MDTRLLPLVRDYQNAVQSAVGLLVQSGIPLPTSNIEWACSDIPQKGSLLGGIQYFKHGYGCAVHLPSGPVDFDFGAEGQINGFDWWRLSLFADERLQEYGFASAKEIELAITNAVQSGVITDSGYILHYLASVPGA